MSLTYIKPKDTLIFPMGLQMETGREDRKEVSRDASLINLIIETPERIGKKVSRQLRTLAWVPYVPGGVNYFEGSGYDVLSGPFSGCYMASYTYRGRRRIAHVHTGSGSDCKRFFRGLFYPKPSLYEDLQCFKPFSGESRMFSFLEDTNKMKKIVRKTPGVPTVFGLITRTGELYSLFLVKTGPNNYQVGKVVSKPSTGIV